VVIDTKQPEAMVTFPDGGAYKSEADVTVLATFTEGMSPTAPPKIALSGAGQQVDAQPMELASNQGSPNEPVYTYKHAVTGKETGDVAVTVSAGEDLAGNKMKDQQSTFKVIAGAKVTSVSPGKNVEVYNKAGDEIDIEVTFDKPVTVTVTGTDKPVLKLKGVGEAVYESGSESETLVFRYEVGDNDNASPLSCDGPGALDKKGAEIKGADGLDADPTLPASEADKPLKVGDENLVIDTKAPEATIAFSRDGGEGNVYWKGIEVTVTAQINEALKAGTVPQIALSGTGQQATGNMEPASPQANPNEPVYTYKHTVTGKEAGTVTVTVSGGEDLAGNEVVAEPTAGKTFQVRKQAEVTSVTATKAKDGSYGVGKKIDIEVTFSEKVRVKGEPRLELQVGQADRFVTHVPGTDELTETLVFRYEVVAGDASPNLAYAGADALKAEGGAAIETADGADADLTLPVPGEDNSLNKGKERKIETVAPRATEVTYEPKGPYKPGTKVTLTATFSEPLEEKPQIAFDGEGQESKPAEMTRKTPDVYTYEYTVRRGKGEVAVKLSAGQDAAGNEVEPVPEKGGTFEIEPVPHLSVTAAEAEKVEGSDGETSLSFAVKREDVTTGVTTVKWAVSGSGDKPANAKDFKEGEFPTGTVSFAATQAEKEIVVKVKGDAEVEPTESFKVTLSEPKGGDARIAEGKGVAVGVIRNDDIGKEVTVVAADGVTEPQALPSTTLGAENGVGILDFSLKDGGMDGFPLKVSRIQMETAGNGPFAKVAFTLSGPDIKEPVVGTYAGRKLTFVNLNISVDNDKSEPYTVKAHYTNNKGLVDGEFLRLMVNGKSLLMRAGSSLASEKDAEVTNDPGEKGSKIEVLATKLVLVHQPELRAMTSRNEHAFTTVPKVEARDEFDNLDGDFQGQVELKALSGAEGGEGDLVPGQVAAKEGVAEFSGLKLTYRAKVDGEKFRLEISSGKMKKLESHELTADVVATKLVFVKPPGPREIPSRKEVLFTTVPIVEAQDGGGVKDKDFEEELTLSETGKGVGVFGRPTRRATAGQASFPDLSLTYPAAADGEKFRLRVDDAAGGLELDPGMSEELTVDVVATKLVFTSPPGNALNGRLLVLQPVVQAQDDVGLVDVGFDKEVTLSAREDGTLSGEKVQADKGVTTFQEVAYTAQEPFAGKVLTLVAKVDDLGEAVAAPVKVLYPYDIEMRSGWNFISLPLQTGDMSPREVLPYHVRCYAFENGTYLEPETMEPDKGYVVYYPTDGKITVGGYSLQTTEPRLTLTKGWHLIGGCTKTLSVAKLRQVYPNNLIMVFGYDGVYHKDTTLKPGKGYWVYWYTPSNSPVDLDLNQGLGGVSKPLASASWWEAPWASAGTLWAEGSGQRQEVQLDVVAEGYEPLPPVLPGSEPDLEVRVLLNGQETRTVPLLPEGASLPVSVRGDGVMLGWEMPAGSESVWELVVDGEVHSSQEGGAVRLDGAAAEILLRRGRFVPERFALAQNYPNPFNPSTVIQYDLESGSRVRLRVYDLLGQVVRELVRERQEEGRYRVVWDGRDDDGAVVANGVYVYELEAGEFRGRRKMVMMK
jgi:hypothetical protein